MLRPKVLLVGLYDTNTVALAPEILRSYAESDPIGARFEIATLNVSIFSDSIAEMERKILAEDAAIVGFSTYIWNVGLVRELAARIPGTVILGGPQMNGVGPAFLRENPGVDFVVTGEGEETFVELLQYFAGERGLESIRGIVTADHVGEARPVVADLARVPSPYPRIFQEQPDLEWIAYETSRGCPYLCGFCTWGYSKKMRYHSLERVLSDLDVILSQPKLKRIYLCDSSILLDKPRAKAILGHVAEKNRDVVIRYEFNAEHLDDDIIALLGRLPENEFNFGVQTTNEPALRAMRRPFHREKFERNYEKMARRKERTAITMDVIYGLPGDDLPGFIRSLDYVIGFDQVRWILTNPLILLPGSDFHRDREKHGIVLRDEESFIVESTATFSRADMMEAIRLSFLTSVVFFNERFRDAVKTFARDRGESYVAVIDALFSSLPFPLLETEEYPYLVPSVAADFRARNLAIYRVSRRFSGILSHFDAVTGGAYRALMQGYETAFVPQYHRLVGFAEEEARRAAGDSELPVASARPPAESAARARTPASM